MATVSFMENIQEWVVGGGRPLGTYNPEGGLTIVTTPEPNSGLMFGVCFLLGAIVLRGKFVSHIELSPTLSTRLCADSAVGCEDHQLQLALPAPHVCQPSHNSRGGHSDGARASRPQDQRSDDALCPSRTKAYVGLPSSVWMFAQNAPLTPLLTPG
jgi:hypothetical protein